MTEEQTASNGQQEQNGQQQGEQANQQQESLSFDKWMASQPDNIKDLLDDHTSGLKSALDDERRERRALAARIKELSKTADAGSDLQKQLETLTGKMTETDAKATFYEGAHEAGVKNLRLAWIAAKEFDLIGKNGAVDFAALKATAPELFAIKTPPPANAGSGANQGNGIVTPDMNRAIRALSGRG